MCFLLWANSTARCRWCFVAEFFQVYIVNFLVLSFFAKTECYSPSNLLVRSVSYRTSATYQLSTCRKWYLASFQAFHDHFSYETYKHHASTVTCSESKWKNPPGQNDHSRQKQTTCWKYVFVSINILGHEYTGSASLLRDWGCKIWGKWAVNFDPHQWYVYSYLTPAKPKDFENVWRMISLGYFSSK